jgi:hypothetical protein
MAEGLSINNFLSSLSKRGYQRGNKYFVTFQSIHGFMVKNAILSSVSSGSFADTEEGVSLMSFDVVLNPRSMDRLNSVQAATIFRSNV